ncbi:MAG TPA: hypothetical protein VE175_16235, partial [Woeseiaceae bacterium]|nr:hypothetical protein [Woeseiaceae bacterium]
SDVSVSVTTQAYDNSAGTYRGPDGASADINVVTVRAQISYQGALLGFLQISGPLTIAVQHSERQLKDQ